VSLALASRTGGASHGGAAMGLSPFDLDRLQMLPAIAAAKRRLRGLDRREMPAVQRALELATRLLYEAESSGTSSKGAATGTTGRGGVFPAETIRAAAAVDAADSDSESYSAVSGARASDFSARTIRVDICAPTVTSNILTRIQRTTTVAQLCRRVADVTGWPAQEVGFRIRDRLLPLDTRDARGTAIGVEAAKLVNESVTLQKVQRRPAGGVAGQGSSGYSLVPALSNAGLSGGASFADPDPDWQQQEHTTLLQAGLWDPVLQGGVLVLVAYPRCGPARVEDAIRENIGSRLPRQIERQALLPGRTPVALQRVSDMQVQALPSDSELSAQLGGEISSSGSYTPTSSAGWHRQPDVLFPQLRAACSALGMEGRFVMDPTGSLEPFEGGAAQCMQGIAAALMPGSGGSGGASTSGRGRGSPSGGTGGDRELRGAIDGGTSVHRLMLGAVASTSVEAGTAHSVSSAPTAERAAILGGGRLAGGDAPVGLLPAAVAQLLASPGSSVGAAADYLAQVLAEQSRLELAGVTSDTGSGFGSGSSSPRSSSSSGGGGSSMGGSGGGGGPGLDGQEQGAEEAEESAAATSAAVLQWATRGAAAALTAGLRRSPTLRQALFRALLQWLPVGSALLPGRKDAADAVSGGSASGGATTPSGFSSLLR